jgi:hypothetical protein
MIGKSVTVTLWTGKRNSNHMTQIYTLIATIMTAIIKRIPTVEKAASNMTIRS